MPTVSTYEEEFELSKKSAERPTPTIQTTNDCTAVVKYDKPQPIRWHGLMILGGLIAQFGGVLIYPDGPPRRCLESAFFDEEVPELPTLDEEDIYMNHNVLPAWSTQKMDRIRIPSSHSETTSHGCGQIRDAVLWGQRAPRFRNICHLSTFAIDTPLHFHRQQKSSSTWQNSFCLLKYSVIVLQLSNTAMVPRHPKTQNRHQRGCPRSTPHLPGSEEPDWTGLRTAAAQAGWRTAAAAATTTTSRSPGTAPSQPCPTR